MKLLIVVLVCVTRSQGINYDALVNCTDDTYGGYGVKCDGICLTAALWCNDLFPHYCADSGVMTNDLELCANDEFWKPISCSLTGEDGQEYPGERCTDCVDGTRNYCSYPQGLPKELLKDKLSHIFKSNVPKTCDCVSSQGTNYDALLPCTADWNGNDGMSCGGKCLISAFWCNDKYRMRCPYPGVMTNDPDLCSQDEIWSYLSCNITFGSSFFPGERCTSGCANYCFYPQGTPEDLKFLPTTCETVTCVTASSTIIIVVILVIVIIAAVGGGVYYYKRKQQQGPSHEAPAEATQKSEIA